MPMIMHSCTKLMCWNPSSRQPTYIAVTSTSHIATLFQTTMELAIFLSNGIQTAMELAIYISSIISIVDLTSMVAAVVEEVVGWFSEFCFLVLICK